MRESESAVNKSDCCVWGIIQKVSLMKGHSIIYLWKQWQRQMSEVSKEWQEFPVQLFTCEIVTDVPIEVIDVYEVPNKWNRCLISDGGCQKVIKVFNKW